MTLRFESEEEYHKFLDAQVRDRFRWQQAEKEDTPDVEPKPIIPESTMNKTEARFADYLEQLKHMKEIVAWRFEPIKFVLARNVKGARNSTTYTPDFLAVYPDHFTFFEVKGFWRDDALVKIKVAAELFPWVDWQAVRWQKGEWVFNKF